ncbi:ABC transporter permease subunit [Virgibacillus salarius]
MLKYLPFSEEMCFIVKVVIKVTLFYLLGIIGILCISVFPQFFAKGDITNIILYFHDLWKFLGNFIQPGSWTYQIEGSIGEFPIFKTLWVPFTYSMSILFSAICIAFAIAFILAFFVNSLPKQVVQGIKQFLEFLETIPDLVFVVLLQMLVIYIYNKTGVSLFTLGSYMDDRAYAGPIITLSILPMIFLFKILLFLIEEEFSKDYVRFLKSKGLSKTVILIRHVFRNILPSAFHQSKLIIWATLSSQFIIERIFNVNGLTFYIIESFSPMTIAVSLILLFTPFFITFQLIDLWVDEATTFESHDLAKIPSFQPISCVMKHIKIIHWKKLLPRIPIASLRRQLKNYKFAIGCLFFILTIGGSIGYSIITDNHVDQANIFYEEDGTTIKSTPPHPPGHPFLLGSDKEGFDLLDQLIIGAKYTLVFGFLIAFLRVAIGLCGGILFAFSISKRKQSWLSKIVDSIHFLPLTLIAYILLKPILQLGWEMEPSYTISERILIEIIILTVLVIPLTTVLIGKDITNILQQEFITSASVLGGSRFHILRHHVMPHLFPKLTILFGQQFIQVLFIFIHLGMLDLFFGGTIMGSAMFNEPPKSLTNEWSGVIGNTIHSFKSGQYWLILFPLLAFMLSIFAMQLIINGIKEVQQAKIGVTAKKYKSKRTINHKENTENMFAPTSNRFQLVHDKKAR